MSSESQIFSTKVYPYDATFLWNASWYTSWSKGGFL